MPAANYYLAKAVRRTEVLQGTNFAFADGNFADYVCGGTMDNPKYAKADEVQMPELPGWTFVLGAGIDGAYGIEYDYFAELYFDLTAGVKSDVYDLSAVKDGTVTVSIEVASSIDCGMNVGVASYDEEMGGYYMADVAMFMDEPVPSEFTKYEFTLSGCNDKSYFMIAPYPMTNPETGKPAGNLYFKSIKVNGELERTVDVTLPLGQVQGQTTEAEFEAVVNEGDTYGVAVQAFTTDWDMWLLREGPLSQYTYATGAAGIQNVEAAEAENGTVRYYNLQGIEVAQPESGLYIRVNGNKATKMLKK